MLSCSYITICEATIEIANFIIVYQSVEDTSEDCDSKYSAVKVEIISTGFLAAKQALHAVI